MSLFPLAAGASGLNEKKILAGLGPPHLLGISLEQLLLTCLSRLQLNAAFI